MYICKFLNTEPGYYEDGKFGIRLENIELVVSAKTPHNHKNRGFLTFETVTLVPIQTSLLDVSMLTDKEVYIYVYIYYLFILFKYSTFSLMFHIFYFRLNI